MNNNDLANLLRKIVREEIQAETKPIKAEMQVMKQALTRIEQKLEREVTDIAEHIVEIMTRLNRVDDHETRIRQLEEDTQLPRSH